MRSRRFALVATSAATAFAALLPPAGAAGPVAFGPIVRVTTPGASNCPVEGEPDVVVTKAGTWVGYNDDHDCLYPVVSELTRLTTVQLLPAGGGKPKVVPLKPLKAGDYLSGDPALAPDPKGDGVYLATLYAHASGGVTIEMFRISPSLTVRHVPSPAVHAPAQSSDDKEFIASDTNPRSRYRGRVYLAWDDFAQLGVVFRAFTGSGWTPPVRLATEPGKPDVAVAPNGDVAIAYETSTGVVARVSRDGGRSFGRSVVAITGGEPGRADPSCPLRPTVGTRQRATKAVRAAFDAAGRLHVVAAVNTTGTPSAGVVAGGASSVVHAVSANRGATFTSAPVGEATAVRFHPAIAPTPSGGVAVAWLQVADVAATSYDAYLAVAARGSRSFGPPVRVSAAAATFPSAMEAMLNSNCYGIGDYIGLATSKRGVVVAWPTTDDKTRPHTDSDVLVREAILR